MALALLALSMVAALVVPSPAGAADRFPWESLGTSPSDLVGAGFPVTPKDLEFIMQQIQMGEAHAAAIANPANSGVEPCSLLIGNGPNQLPASEGNVHEFMLGIRTISGMCNNLLPGQENFGAGDVAFERMTDPVVDPIYATLNADVTDPEPRRISNIIVDQSDNNPAAVAAAGNPPVAVPTGAEQEILNTAPDEGLSAPFNSMLTFFGQFFDHGLDFVDKGNGTVFIALDPSDPLHSSNSGGSPFADFVPMSRTVLDPINGQPTNKTTPFVDQNQTYGSDPAKTAFLREYVPGTITPTGRLIEGASGGMATWGELKTYVAANFGFQLVDEDVHHVPLIATDLYGNLIPAAGQNAQIALDDGTFLVGNRLAPVAIPKGLAPGTGNALLTSENFIADIANAAAPGQLPGDVPADGDTVITDIAITSVPGTPNPNAGAVAGEVYVPFPPFVVPGGFNVYDNEMLDAHFMAGDGRVNENIALTSVHHIFHSEHNRLTEDIELTVAGTNPDHADAVTAEVAAFFNPGLGSLYGNRLFAAAKLVTEMEYQHLVFEEFGRTVVPNIDVFLAYDSSINAAIQGEFAHSVYRFGHSMLSTDVARYQPDGTPDNLSLFDAFLNPPAWQNLDQTLNGGANGTVSYATADEAAGAVFRGGVAQVGNEIDEFVVDALRNQLLGLPLDLTAINMARTRDAQIPRLNPARRDFFAQTGSPTLAPYDSWFEFGQGLKNGDDSLVNFIAAYGIHSTLDRSEPTWATATDPVGDLRAAAQALVDNSKPGVSDPDAVAFMLGLNDPAGVNYTNVGGIPVTGLEDVDLWVGGLAEAKFAFGSMLGSTFEHVFETQMENLQNGDRFYYLGRLAGQDLLNALEGNSLSEMVTRNTDAEGLPANVFSVPTYTFDLNAQTNPTGIVDDPATVEYDETLLLTRLADGTIAYFGGEHTNFIGVDTATDRAQGGAGDDTMRGNGGNDFLRGGDGGDNIIGGEGDDRLTDINGDDDIKGGPGDDYINGGAGFDLLQGGDGDDFINGGEDDSETLAGSGDDVVFAGNSMDAVHGGAGDDWIEGGPGPDEVFGDQGLPILLDNQEPLEGGNDVLIGGTNLDALLGEGGNDIFVAGQGTDDHEGGLSYDWYTHYSDPQPGDTDLSVGEFTPAPVDPLADAFNLVEGLSGWQFDDVLYGDGKGLDIGGNDLLASEIAELPGLAAVLPDGATGFPGTGNIILGGGGSDELQGGEFDDLLDGDAWLRVQLEQNGNLYNRLGPLEAGVANGTIDPGTINIQREIHAGTRGGDVDVAVFRNPSADYDFLESISGGSGIFTVDHVRGLGLVVPPDVPRSEDDGRDQLRNIERLIFRDAFNDPALFPEEIIELCDGRIATIFAPPGATVGVALTGTSGDDVIVGSNFNDIINGNGGNDIICGRGGDDIIDGGAGNDIIYGDNGNDTISGGIDNDLLFGDAGLDAVNGDAGADILSGGLGVDTLNGGTGGDQLFGDEGADILLGGDDPDFLSGGLGVDSYSGGAGDDWLEGGEEGESMFGDAGNDIIYGYGGDDILNGGLGGDYLWGGLGIDTYVGGDGNDYLDGGDAGDDAGETMDGGAGDDIILGHGGDDTLIGGPVVGDGSDYLWGGTGVDSFFGGDGIDYLDGNDGGEGAGETMDGGAGDDTVLGYGGDDTLIGGPAVGDGSDYLWGGPGIDSFFGGDGIDYLDGNDAGEGAGETMDGGDGADFVIGWGGDDILDGGAGDGDYVWGGDGADTLSGGAGLNDVCEDPQLGTYDVSCEFEL